MTAVQDRLDPRTKDVLDRSNDERIRYIERDRFVPHAATDAVLALLGNLVERADSIRPPCLAVVGDSDSGKSTLMNQFLVMEQGRHPKAHPRAIYITLDAYPLVEVMQIALLTALNIPSSVSSFRRQNQSNDSIQRGIRETGIRLIIIDEIQHLLNLPRGMQVTAWDWIKWISTANRVSVCVCGIPGSEHVVVTERQLHTRFSILHLPRWKVGPAFEQFLIAFERSLPLRNASGLGSLDFQKGILVQTRSKQQISGLTGGVKKVIECAAISAVRSGVERITPELLGAWRGVHEQPA